MNTTICIPVAPYHKDTLPRALTSIHWQTQPCRALYMIDGDQRGPGWARNRLLAQVDTPYVAFLDADDWIDRTFIAECEKAIRPKRYVYTDWWQDDRYIETHSHPWCDTDWHPITCLLWTQDARIVGGFDEKLPSVEDTDFWMKVMAQQICGIHVKKGLFHYGKEGQRSKTAIEDQSLYYWRDKILARYRRVMACCGDKDAYDTSIPVGQRQPNDVLAMALWGGNHVEHGRASGRHYPRIGYPKTTWVDPRDVEMNPNLWRMVEESANVETPAPAGIQDMARVFGNGRQAPPPPPPPQDLPTVAPDFTPNVVHVVEVARERLGK